MKRVWIGLLTIALFGFGGVLPVAAAGGLTSGTTLQTDPPLNLKTGVIDSTGSFAYFGTSENPAKVVTVRLKDDAGAWLVTPIVTSNQPNLGNNYDDEPIVVNQFQKSLINSDSDTVYLISGERPARVVRYYTDSSMPPVINTMSEGATVYSGVQHPTAPYLYYGINNGDRWDWYDQIVNGILKANIGLNDNYFLEFPDEGNITAAVIDSTGEFAYFASNQRSDHPGQINKVRLLSSGGNILNTPELVSSFNLDAAYDMSGAAVIATGNQVAYFATSEDSGRFSRIVQFNTQTAGRTYMDLPANAGIVKSLLMSPDGSALYVLTSSRLLQYDVTENMVTLNQTATFNLTGTPETAVISPDGAKIYVGFAEGKISEFQVSYTVTYDENGPNINGGTPNAQIKTHGQTLTIVGNIGRPNHNNSFLHVQPLLRSGHTFEGWNTAQDGTGVTYAENSSYTENAPKLLYAKWARVTYTITYDPNGATSGTTPNSQTGVHDAVSITMADNTGMLSKTGYTFVGWNTSEDGGTETRYPTDNYYMTNASLTLYAEWSPNEYTLSFESNGGSESTAITATYNSTVTLPAPTREGYAFNRWNGNQTLDGVGYAGNATYNMTLDTTLYAEWSTSNYVLLFDTQEGSLINLISYPFQTSITAPANPTKTGYTFAGWSPSIPATMPANDVTVTAEWSTTNYTLTFNSNAAGVANPANQTRAYTANLGTLPTLSRMGHTFDGWLINAEAVSSDTPMPASDLTLVAAWRAKDYSTISNSTELDPGEEVTTNATVVNNTFTIPVSAKLTTETFSGSGTINNYGTLETDTISLTGSLLNDGTLTTKQAISISGGGIFTASANSQITVHHTPAAKTSSLSNTRVQDVTGRFIADGILTIVLDDEVLDLPKYTFDILDTEDIQGEFDEVNLPDLPSGYFWDSSTLYSAGTLSIIGTATGLSGRPLNYPNPFKWSQGTYIGYTLNGANDTELRVYTIRGQEIYKKSFTANVDQGALAGYNKVQITPSSTAEAWSAGIYPYLILQNGDVIGRGRMVVIP